MALPKSRDQCQIQVENILQPFNGSSGFVGKDLDEIRSRLVTGGLQSIVVELLHGVLDLVVDLCSGQGAVDAGSGLGRVAPEEACRGSRISNWSPSTCLNAASLLPCLSRTTTLPPAR